MSYRKIVVDDVNYSYKVGKSCVEIRDAEFKRIATVFKHIILNMLPPYCDGIRNS